MPVLENQRSNHPKAQGEKSRSYNMTEIDTGAGDSRFDYTRNALESRAARRMANEKKLGLPVKPTIGHDTPINGGVYEGEYSGEAIVVDTTSPEHPAVNLALRTIVESIKLPDGRIDKSKVLDAVFEYVSSHMRYDNNAVEGIFQEYGQGVDGAEISLDTYIDKGVGVCRHQALFVGALLEKLANQGVIRGKVSVERSHMGRDNEDTRDGHSWVRYTNRASIVYILDVAHNVREPLDSLMERRRQGKKEIWDYGREEDHARLLAKIVQGAIETEQKWSSNTSSAVIEYDDNGLIIVPDWVKNAGSKAGASAGEVIKEPIKEGEASRDKKSLKTPEQITAEQFWNAHSEIKEEITDAIYRAGTFDACAAANRIAGDIGRMSRIVGLQPDIVVYLQEAHGICDQVAASGRDQFSPYYKKEQIGLRRVLKMFTALGPQ